MRVPYPPRPGPSQKPVCQFSGDGLFAYARFAEAVTRAGTVGRVWGYLTTHDLKGGS